MTSSAQDPTAYERDDVQDYLRDVTGDVPNPHDPIDVRVVEAPAEVSRTASDSVFDTIVIQPGDNAVRMVVPAQRNRTRLVLRNLSNGGGADAVILVAGQDQFSGPAGRLDNIYTPGTFQLFGNVRSSAQSELIVLATGPIYVRGPGINAAVLVLCWQAEYREDLAR